MGAATPCAIAAVSSWARDWTSRPRSFPPGFRARPPEGWGTETRSVPHPPAFVPWSLCAVAESQASATWKAAPTTAGAGAGPLSTPTTYVTSPSASDAAT